MTFAAVLRKDDFGEWVGTHVYDMEPVQIDHSILYGRTPRSKYYKEATTPSRETRRRCGRARDEASGRGRRRGLRVFEVRGLLERSDYMWSPEFALKPNPEHYAGERAAFGHDVALGAGGNTAVVGAPYSENHGVYEQQNIFAARPAAISGWAS